MAIETKRRSGYRKVGGIYLVGALRAVCDKLPIPLEVCPTCGQGFKVKRNVTAFKPYDFFGGSHEICQENPGICPVCYPPSGVQYMLPVGRHFYPTPNDFIQESGVFGVSKRVPLVPKDLKIGESYIYLVHDLIVNKGGTFVPGIFASFKVSRIDYLVWHSEVMNEAAMDKYIKKGWTIVPIPDGDIDHAPDRNFAEEKAQRAENN